MILPEKMHGALAEPASVMLSTGLFCGAPHFSPHPTGARGSLTVEFLN